MGGQDAIRGFEFQFLWTLEYGLSAVFSDDAEVTALGVEDVLTTAVDADQDVVDFSLRCGERTRTVAQVKSGGVAAVMTAAQLLDILVRLLTHAAERYLVVTNRSADDRLTKLLAVLRAGKSDLRERVLAVAGRSKVAAVLATKDERFWERMRRVQVVLDTRGIEQVRMDVRERVRAARHHVAPSTVGWDAAGLVTGYLLWEVMAKGAGAAQTELTMPDLLAVLGTDAASLKALMRERDWAVPVTPLPRTGDIPRPEVLARMREHLPVPVPRDRAPVCVLTGLSGIGKSSLAAAWSDDNADTYAMIMWIDATTSSRITASFTAVAVWLQDHGLLADGDRAVPLRQRVVGALGRSARPWLLVFDNCADQMVVRDWIPPSGHGHVIVTSTDQTRLVGPAAAKVEVGAMTDSEAVDLLARRILAGRSPADDDRRSLRRLATRLHNWPLALEITAAYLMATVLEYHSDLARSIAKFERLLQRAMDDRPSVPVGYPDTVVGTITAMWQRVTGRTDPAAVLAAQALRGAAFVASRQIPVQLLLAAAADTVLNTFPHYAQSDPPVGEVVRAMKRDSLVTADEPLPLPLIESGGPIDVGPIGVSVAMNDIVQFIVRGLVDNEGVTDITLFKLTFCAQAWLQTFTSSDETRAAVSIVSHAIELSERTIELGVVNRASALLWGNTAGVLGAWEAWPRVARYVVAELTYLDSVTDDESAVLRIQTLASYAHVLYQLADRPRDVADQIVSALERLIAEVPRAVALHEQAAAESIRWAGATVQNLLNHGAEHPQLAALQSALRDFHRMLPTTTRLDWFDELLGLNQLIRTGRAAEARTQGEALLAQMNHDHTEYPQVLRIIAEACVDTGDWDGADAIVARFEDTARARALQRFDIATVIRNLGIACIGGMTTQEHRAFRVFAAIGRIADLAREQEIPIQAGDRDILAVLQALRCYLDEDKAACTAWLAEAVPAEIAAVERTGLVDRILRLLLTWCEDTADRQATTPFEPPDDGGEMTFGRPRVPAPDTVLPIDEDAMRTLLLHHGAGPAPARALGSVEVHRAAGGPPREPLEVAVETCLAARMLGLQTDIAEVALFALHDDGHIRLDEPQEMAMANPTKVRTCRVPHHVAWVRSPGHLVDPVVPQLEAVRAIARHEQLHRHPVVVPSLSEDDIPIVRREGLLIAYQHLGTYRVDDVAAALPPDRRRVCHTNAFFVAYQALLALGATHPDFVASVEHTHSSLAGLIVQPEPLITTLTERARMSDWSTTTASPRRADG
ncbi:hypothetical protein [Amycolatopsis taiwanensis]|uniref:hypothetical protein n=1 Tax=Amycolatopsis taiwanensis TaxID=342230 RepID=UPI000485FDC2|nr:hypothetical protein [Amycolatopsis taiwanensis]